MISSSSSKKQLDFFRKTDKIEKKRSNILIDTATSICSSTESSSLKNWISVRRWMKICSQEFEKCLIAFLPVHINYPKKYVWQQFLQILYGLDSSAVWDKIVILVFVNIISQIFYLLPWKNKTRYHFLHIHVRYTTSSKRYSSVKRLYYKYWKNIPLLCPIYLSMLLLNALFKKYW